MSFGADLSAPLPSEAAFESGELFAEALFCSWPWDRFGAGDSSLACLVTLVWLDWLTPLFYVLLLPDWFSFKFVWLPSLFFPASSTIFRSLSVSYRYIAWLFSSQLLSWFAKFLYWLLRPFENGCFNCYSVSWSTLLESERSDASAMASASWRADFSSSEIVSYFGGKSFGSSVFS